MSTGTITRTGSRRVDERRRRARNHTRVVDAIRHFHPTRVIISVNRGWHLQAPDSSAHKARCLYTFERREGANGAGGEIGVGGGNGDGNGVGDGNADVNGDGDGDGARTRTGVEVNEGTQDGNGDGSRDGARTGTGMGTGVETRGRTQDGNGDGSGDGNESSSGDGNGGEDGNGDGNEDGIGEGGGEAKKRKKPRKSCRRDVGNGGDLDRKRK